jgi:hypothetical protein
MVACCLHPDSCYVSTASVVDDSMRTGCWWNGTDKRNRCIRGKTCPRAATKLSWPGPASREGLRGKRPATNRLNHETSSFT